MRWLFALLCLTFVSLAQANAAPSLEDKMDKALVLKSGRELLFLNKDNILKSYRVSLDKRPASLRLAEGGNRILEGFYWIDWYKTSNDYNLSVHISYPSAHDMAKAWEKSPPASGTIMAHGTPLDGKYPEWYSPTLDWTNGCIVVNNTDMHEVWSVVRDDMLVGIRP